MDYRSNKESAIRTEDRQSSNANEQDKPVKLAEHIKQLLKVKNKFSDEQSRMIMTIEELGDKVGIKRGVFAKIVNQSRPNKHTASRDCIIAICAVIGLNEKESNETLRIYQMAALDSKLKREKKIIDELENGHETLESFNTALISEPNPVEPLHVINPRGASKEVSIAQEEGRYEALRTKVKTYTQDDPYDSLETAYGFHRYYTSATMIVKERATGRVFRLTAEPSGDLCCWEKPEPASEEVSKLLEMAKQEQDPKKSMEILESIPTTPMNYKTYRNVKETGVFEEFFKRLLKMARGELRRHAAYLYDTKNYGQRIGAGIRNDAFVFFVEEFNYDRPERNEYYLMEYSNGNCRLSVSYKSRFMQLYLDPDEYRTYYKEDNPQPFARYGSIAEIETRINNCGNDADRKGVLWLRKRAYKKLEAVVLEHLEKLRNAPEKPATEFVRNIDAIWDCRDKVCWYYKVMPDFRCMEDEEADWVKPGLSEVDFPAESGKTVTITLTDLYRAFELGFHDIQEICRVKAQLGSIEAVIG